VISIFNVFFNLVLPPVFLFSILRNYISKFLYIKRFVRVSNFDHLKYN